MKSFPLVGLALFLLFSLIMDVSSGAPGEVSGGKGTSGGSKGWGSSGSGGGGGGAGGGGKEKGGGKSGAGGNEKGGADGGGKGSGKTGGGGGGGNQKGSGAGGGEGDPGATADGGGGKAGGKAGIRAPEDAEKGSFKDCPQCRNKPENPEGPTCGKPKKPPADGNPYRWYRNDCEIECDDSVKVDPKFCSSFYRSMGMSV